jgi:hypothetical protein
LLLRMPYGARKIVSLKINWSRFMAEVDKYAHLPRTDLVTRIERLETALKRSEKKFAKLSKNQVNTSSFANSPLTRAERSH